MERGHYQMYFNNLLRLYSPFQLSHFLIALFLCACLYFFIWLWQKLQWCSIHFNCPYLRFRIADAIMLLPYPFFFLVCFVSFYQREHTSYCWICKAYVIFINRFLFYVCFVMRLLRIYIFVSWGSWTGC